MIIKSKALTAIGLVLALAVGPAVAAAQGSPAAPIATPGPGGAQPKTDLEAIALNPAQVALLRQALNQAPAQGLAGDYAPLGLDGLLASPDPAARHRGEALLKSAVLRYAQAVHRGRVAAGDFDPDWGLKPAAYDPLPDFQAAVAGDRLQAWLDSLPPAYAGYQQLVKALAGYRAIAARGGWKALPTGDVIAAGDSDPRVPALRERLAAEDLSAPAPQPAAPQPTGATPAAAPAQPAAETLDDATVQTLKAFQRRHGLAEDGKLTKATLEALNVPVEDRIQQITANMERWRWLPDTLQPDRVQVNIAAAVMALFKDGQPVLAMKAAPGRPKDRTPMLVSQIRSIELNPPWNVPADIAKKELYPKERAHPGYFEREDFHIIRTADGGERLQQKAGAKSALGQVKFDFANPYGVYLHDTPSHAAFNRSNRLVSHGCVRLEKPLDLAAMLLQNQKDGAWSLQTISDKISQGGTQWVRLDKPVDVLLLYWTAFMGPDGRMNFMPDPYDWDHELLLKISGEKYSRA